MILDICAYSLSALTVLLFGISLFRSSRGIVRAAASAAFLAAALLAAHLVERSLHIRFVALTGTFESLIFYSMVILLLTGLYALRKRRPASNTLAFFSSFTAIGLLLIATSPLVSGTVKPPVPALRSAWLLLHVSFSFIGEAFFVFAFIAALMMLTASRGEKRGVYQAMTYKAVLLGYPFFTLGALIFGAVWAEAAWGSFWSWDPKETWALITWLVYSLYLHVRLAWPARQRLAAWIVVAGFLCTLFTFFGVNYLLGGLHSYQ